MKRAVRKCICPLCGEWTQSFYIENTNPADIRNRKLLEERFPNDGPIFDKLWQTKPVVPKLTLIPVETTPWFHLASASSTMVSLGAAIWILGLETLGYFCIAISLLGLMVSYFAIRDLYRKNKHIRLRYTKEQVDYEIYMARWVKLACCLRDQIVFVPMLGSFDSLSEFLEKQDPGLFEDIDIREFQGEK